MPDQDADVRLYWPSVSGYETDGSLSFRFTGSERDCRFTGGFPVATDDPDFQFWAWIHEHRHSLPEFFEEYYIPSLRQHFLAGHPSFLMPEDILCVVVAEWSGPARMVESAFRRELMTRTLPMPVRFLSTDSAEVDATFPQLRPFLHGWGEIFVFRGGRCDLFLAPGRHPSSISKVIDCLFKSYAD
jgi:hypothetical protein